MKMQPLSRYGEPVPPLPTLSDATTNDLFGLQKYPPLGKAFGLNEIKFYSLLWSARKRTAESESSRVTSEQSPFEEIEQRQRAERQSVIDQIRVMGFACAQEIYSRLVHLDEITEDEYPDEELICVPSLKDFRKFLALRCDWICPEICTSARGNISAEWYIDDFHHIAVDFLGDGKLKFVMFAPDIKRPEKTVPISGIPSIEGFLEAVAPFKVRDWITDGQR